MGYIIKAPTGGGGGGDATAANQTLQLAQIEDQSINQSVLKDTNGNSVLKDISEISVFNDNITRESVFKNNQNESVFKTTNNDSIFDKSKISSATTTRTQAFSDANAAALAVQIQSWLQSNIVVIIQIVYADHGGFSPNPYTALIIYNTI
jgi:hypothetical protein